MGRNNKYETHVQPRLDELVELWENGMTEKEISEELGVSQQSFEKYKKEHPELRDRLINARKKKIRQIKSSLMRRAEGFHETETKTVIKDENGKVTRIVEQVDKYYPPDVGAIHLWLKNNDSEWRNDDETTVGLKRAKLELEKLKAEAENW